MADHRIKNLRQDYDRGALSEEDLGDDPIAVFGAWMDAAIAADIAEPHAASLATADADGQPSARIVLCRGFDERGFCFYTNYEGRKAEDMAANPKAALCFFWQPLERQVRMRFHAAQPERLEG